MKNNSVCGVEGRKMVDFGLFHGQGLCVYYCVLLQTFLLPSCLLQTDICGCVLYLSETYACPYRQADRLPIVCVWTELEGLVRREACEGT